MAQLFSPDVFVRVKIECYKISEGAKNFYPLAFLLRKKIWTSLAEAKRSQSLLPPPHQKNFERNFAAEGLEFTFKRNLPFQDEKDHLVYFLSHSLSLFLSLSLSLSQCCYLFSSRCLFPLL